MSGGSPNADGYGRPSARDAARDAARVETASKRLTFNLPVQEDTERDDDDDGYSDDSMVAPDRAGSPGPRTRHRGGESDHALDGSNLT
jgi:hypothetical protein